MNNTPHPSEFDAYRKYVEECESEEAEPHPVHMWRMLGRPSGILGEVG